MASCVAGSGCHHRAGPDPAPHGGRRRWRGRARSPDESSSLHARTPRSHRPNAQAQHALLPWTPPRGRIWGRSWACSTRPRTGSTAATSSRCSPPPSPCSTPCKVHSLVGDHGFVCFFRCCVVDDDDDAAVRSVPSEAARTGRAVPEEGSRSGPHQDQSSLELGGTRWTCLCWSPSSLLSILPCATQGRSVRLCGRKPPMAWTATTTGGCQFWSGTWPCPARGGTHLGTGPVRQQGVYSSASKATKLPCLSSTSQARPRPCTTPSRVTEEAMLPFCSFPTPTGRPTSLSCCHFLVK
nr:uncharacterized protein LOC109759434 [Aegilops tauschii subsp. strangulata]